MPMAADIEVTTRGTAPWASAATGWVCSGIALAALHLALVCISREFWYDRPLSEQPVLLLVALQLAAGAVFLISAWLIRRGTDSFSVLGWILLVGVVIRATMIGSSPMLEYDYYRYLWDGAVLAHGMNPFAHSPQAVIECAPSIPPELCKLGRDSGNVLARISFPSLRTIYPFTAQLVFGLSHLISPWSTGAWKVTLAVFDIAALGILLCALSDARLARSAILVYWWNPLLVLTTYNAGHLDVITLPLAVGAVLLALRQRPVSASVVLAFAVCTKLWPIMLFPLILRSAWDRPRTVAAASILFFLTAGILMIPIYLAGIDEGSGFVAYARHWEMNAGLYRLLAEAVAYTVDLLSPGEAYVGTTVRWTVATVLALWTLWLCRMNPGDPSKPWDRALLIVAAGFLLSPTQFPWYYLWVIPFLVLSPRPSLLLLNCTLFLYYLVYYFRGIGEPELFDRYIPLLEYVPFWAVVAWEILRSRRALHARE